MSEDLHFKIMMDLVNQPELPKQVEDGINAAYQNISNSIVCTLEDWEDEKDKQLKELAEAYINLLDDLYHHKEKVIEDCERLSCGGDGVRARCIYCPINSQFSLLGRINPDVYKLAQHLTNETSHEDK